MAVGAAFGAALVLFGAPQTGVDESSKVAEDRILAVVDGSPITVDDLEAEMVRRGGAANFASREALGALLDDMVRLEALAANARGLGFDAEHGIRQEIKHTLAGRYRREYLDPSLENLKVGEDEVAEFYSDHRDRFVIPAAARAAVIYFAYPATASDQRRQEVAERAAGVREQALLLPAEAHFGALAVENSDDQATRYLGGVVGWVAEGQKDSRWGSEILEQIFALAEPGSLSQPIETPTGVYLVKLLETRPASARPLDEVRPAIKHELLAAKTREVTERFYAAATDKVAVDVRRERLAAVEIPKAAVAERGPPPLPHT